MENVRCTRMREIKAIMLAVLPLVLVAEEAPAQQDARVKTVVIGLSARRGVDEGLALAMSDVVQGVISGDSTRLVLGREDIRRVLSFEEERAALGCDDASCLSEIASALDVDRMVTGSIDKVGTSYFVVVTEIDARSVEPLGRVQRRLPLNEDELITGVQQMAVELLGASGGVASLSPSKAGPGGSLFIKAEPPGAKVFVAGKERGVTPLRVDGLEPGTHKVTIAAVGFAPVEMEVPVFKSDVTEVRGKLGERHEPTSEEIEEYADAKGWNNITGWTRLAGGLGCCVLGAPCAAGTAGPTFAYLSGSGDPLNLGALLCGGLTGLCGAAVCGWGAFDLFNPPEDPLSASEPTHRLTVAPPKGRGKTKTFELDAVSDDEMAH